VDFFTTVRNHSVILYQEPPFKTKNLIKIWYIICFINNVLIKTKVIVVLITVLVGIFGLSTLITVSIQRKSLLEDKTQDAVIITELIENSIASSMSKGKAEEVQQILLDINKSREINRIRILTDEGKILKSSDLSEIGAPSKEYILFGSSTPNPIIRDNLIYVYRPIKNRPQCYRCHDPKSKINGIIELTMDFSRQLKVINTLKKTLMTVNALSLVAMAVLLSMLLGHFILGPLKKLMNTIQQVERGDLSARVYLNTDDEIGIIGDSFNRMLRQIQELYEKDILKERELSRAKAELKHKQVLEELNTQLKYKIKEIEAANKAITSLTKELKEKNIKLESMVKRLKKINEIGRVLTTMLESQELLKSIAKACAEVLNVDQAFLHLKDENNRLLTIKYVEGLGVDTTDEISVELSPIFEKIFQEDKPIRITNMSGIKNKAVLATPLRFHGRTVGALIVQNKKDEEFSPEEMEILSTFANQAVVAIENAWLYERIKTSYLTTIQALINALEASDRYTKGHSERVRRLVTEFARYLGLSMKDIEILEHAAVLHDVGKIGIEDNVLKKPGLLNTEEYNLIKAHPVIGDEILAPIERFEDVREAVLQHHERYDGKGYPFGLAAEEISLKARILAIADVFDAMMTERPYRPAIPYEYVIKELKSQAGKQFDPHLVYAFIEMLQDKGPSFLASLGYDIESTIFSEQV